MVHYPDHLDFEHSRALLDATINASCNAAVDASIDASLDIAEAGVHTSESSFAPDGLLLLEGHSVYAHTDTLRERLHNQWLDVPEQSGSICAAPSDLSGSVPPYPSFQFDMFGGLSGGFDPQLELAYLEYPRARPGIDAYAPNTAYAGSLSGQSDPWLGTGHNPTLHDPTSLGYTGIDQAGAASIGTPSFSLDRLLPSGVSGIDLDPLGEQEIPIYSPHVSPFDVLADATSLSYHDPSLSFSTRQDVLPTLGSIFGMSTTLPAINASSTPTPSLYTSPLPAPALPPSVVTGAQNGSDAVVPEKGTSVFPSSSSEPPAKKPRVRTKKASLSKRSRKNATSAPSPDSASSSTLQSPCTSQSCFADAPERVITFKRRTRRIAVAEASDMLATFLATVSESTDPSDQFACPFCDYVQAKRRKPDLLRHVKSHFQGTDWPCCGVPVEWAEEKLGLSEAVIAAYAAEGRVYEFRGVRMVGGCPIVKVLSRCDALARHLSNSWAKWRKKCKAVRRGEGEPKCYGECGGHEKQQLPCLGNPYGYWLLGNQVKEAAGADVSASEYECEED